MNQEQLLDKILIEVVDIKERLKDMPTREEMNLKFDKLLGTTDRFIKLHETLDQELAFLRNKYNRLEERLVVVERRLQVA